MYWLACWNSNLKFSGLRLGPCHHVVSLDKKLNSSLSVSTKEYKWYQQARVEQAFQLHATETGLS